MKYTHLFFDLDGTLTESGPGIMNCVKYALEKFGINESDTEKLKRFIGPPLVNSFMDFYNFSESDAREAMRIYRERFGTIGIFENAVYSGIPETLQKLSEEGKKLYVATSKPEIYVPKILEHFGLAKYFSDAVGSDIEETRSSKALVIEYAIKKNNLEEEAASNRIVMIGDRKHDLIGAQENALESIGCLWGYGSREELEKYKATTIIENPEDLLKI
ncbi:MAG: HAD family hydrolase [Treponema sp.]|nr:HAD family hydrolase [Treponema sp.]